MLLVFGQYMLFQVGFVGEFRVAQLASKRFLRDVPIAHMIGQSGGRRARHVAQCAFVAVDVNVNVTGEQLFGEEELATMHTLVFFCEEIIL